MAASPPPADPDAPLVASLKSGDERALRPLMARHSGRLRQIALRMTGRTDEADDIVQEAFIAFWRRAGSLVEDGRPYGAYLTRIVVNRCIDRARRETLRRWIGLDSVPEIEDRAPSAEDRLTGRSELAAVARDLRDLPARQRAAILLISTEDHGIADVAAILGVSVGAVEQLLVRARRTLRIRAMARQETPKGTMGT